MTVFENEKLLIEKRISEIERNKETAGMDRTIVIAGGSPVLESDAPEYKALKTMMDILNKKNEELMGQDYLAIREKTTLPKLTFEDEMALSKIGEDRVIARKARDQEKRLVIARIAEIEKDYKKNLGQRSTTSNKTGKRILKASEPEYDALNDMLAIFVKGFNEKDYDDYMSLRAKTNLKTMSNTEYRELFGRELENSDVKDEVQTEFTASQEVDSPNKTTEEMRLKEKNLIVEKMHDIEEDYVKAIVGTPTATAKNGRRITKERRDEYNYLVDLLEIISKDYDTEEYYEYKNIRDKTSLEPISERDYATLLGKEKPMSAHAEEVPTKEEAPVDEDAAKETEDTTIAVIEEPEPVLSNDTRIVKDNYFENDIEPTIATIDTPNGGVDIIDAPKPTSKKDEKKSEPEELFEVIETTPWEWIKAHKKQLLIALGLTALTITVAIFLTQLMPALAAASKAQNVAGLAAEMIKNGSMWHGATTAEQLALHSANTGLASTLSSITGIESSFAPASGLWTFGAETLSKFAASTAAEAALASAKVASLTKLTSLTGLVGLGSLGVGLAPKKRSKDYKEILSMIRELKEKEKNITLEEINNISNMINSRILTSDNLSSEEKGILFKRLEKTLKNIRKKRKNQNEYISPNIDDIEFVPNPDEYEEKELLALTDGSTSLGDEKDGYDDNETDKRIGL